METKVLQESTEKCISMTKSLIKFNPESMICAYAKGTDACQVSTKSSFENMSGKFISGRFWRSAFYWSRSEPFRCLRSRVIWRRLRSTFPGNLRKAHDFFDPGLDHVDDRANLSVTLQRSSFEKTTDEAFGSTSKELSRSATHHPTAKLLHRLIE